MNPPYEQRAILVNLPGLGRSPPAGPALLQLCRRDRHSVRRAKAAGGDRSDRQRTVSMPRRTRPATGRSPCASPRWPGSCRSAWRPPHSVEVVSLDDGRPLGISAGSTRSRIRPRQLCHTVLRGVRLEVADVLVAALVNLQGDAGRIGRTIRFCSAIEVRREGQPAGEGAEQHIDVIPVDQPLELRLRGLVRGLLVADDDLDRLAEQAPAWLISSMQSSYQPSGRARPPVIGKEAPIPDRRAPAPQGPRRPRARAAEAYIIASLANDPRTPARASRKAAGSSGTACRKSSPANLCARALGIPLTRSDEGAGGVCAVLQSRVPAVSPEHERASHCQ